jgi:hypothetical protein
MEEALTGRRQGRRRGEGSLVVTSSLQGSRVTVAQLVDKKKKEFISGF